MDSVVTAVAALVTSLTAAAVAGAVITSAIGLVTVKFGARWAVGLFKSIAAK